MKLLICSQMKKIEKNKKMIKMNELEEFEDSFVKLVFRDGDTVVAKRGNLISVGEDFVELQTKENDILVSCSDIVKIQKKLRKLGESD